MSYKDIPTGNTYGDECRLIILHTWSTILENISACGRIRYKEQTTNNTSLTWEVHVYLPLDMSVHTTDEHQEERTTLQWTLSSDEL